MPTYSLANQYRTDTGAAIPLNGGVVPVGVGVNFKANVSDADGDTVKYEVELHQLPATFTGVATHSSGFVSSGSQATTTTASGLAAGNYGWKFRVIDNRGAANNWSSVGNPDFIVQAVGNQTPTYSVANQYRADTGAAIPLNGGVVPVGVGVNFKANVSDADGDTIKYEVELHQLPATFTGVATHSSGFVSSGSQATTATASGLAAGSYGWKFRVVDSRGAANSWSSAGNPDFVVQQSGGNFYLSFPLNYSGWTPYTAQITTVFDHAIGSRYWPGGGVVTYKNERGTEIDPNEPSVDFNHGLLYSFKKADHSAFLVNGNYVGTQGPNGTGPTTLNYDGHPGYDYPVPIGTDVFAAADGVVVKADSSNPNGSGNSCSHSTWQLRLSIAVSPFERGFG